MSRHRHQQSYDRPVKRVRRDSTIVIALPDDLLNVILRHAIFKTNLTTSSVDYFKLYSFLSKFFRISKRFQTLVHLLSPSLTFPPTPDSTGRFAYVTLLMRGDSYLPGALVTAFSLRQSNFDRICMVTPDVSTEAKNLLHLVYTSVVDIKYIYEPKIPTTKWKRFAAHYNHWLSFCLTKLRLFELHQYSKLIFLDIDTLCLDVRAMDDLFTVPTPAGTLTLPPGSTIPHNTLISYRDLNYSCNKFYGISGALMLLRPSLRELASLGKYANSFNFNTRDNAGPDECLLSRYYGSNWRHLSTRFNAVPWKSAPDQALIHYVTHPPWSIKEYWEDYELWFEEARKLTRDFPMCEQVFEKCLEISRKAK
ncbi:hypothetical protein RCL1_001563 [Eukaryota sp. TZLM3-RCL]